MSNFSFSLQILPLCTNTKEIIKTVDSIINLIQNSGLTYHVAPFETTVEGDFKECMQLLNDCILKSSELTDDVFANIKIHFNKKERILSINEKIAKYN